MKKIIRVTVSVLMLIGSGQTFVQAQNLEEDSFITLTRRKANLKRIPSNTTIITADQIKESGAITLAEVLEKATGVDTSGGGSLGSFTTVRMRGVPNSSQVLLVIDDQIAGGVSANQNIDMGQFSVKNIERIEIVRGGSSVLYGANTTGGVIHIITKKQGKDAVSASLGGEVGSHATNSEYGEFGFRQGKMDGYVQYDQYNSKGYQQNSESEHKQASANFGFSFSNGSRISLQVSQLDHDAGSPTGTAVPVSQWDGRRERLSADLTESNEKERTDGRLNIFLPVLNGGQIKSTFYGSDTQLENLNSSSGSGNFRQDIHILGNDTRFIGTEGTTIGATYNRDEFRSTFVGIPPAITDVGVYAQQEFNGDKFEFIPALRYDYHSNSGIQVNPRLTMLYIPSEIWTLSANVARSFRAPSFNDLYSDFGTFVANRSLKPETAWTYDLGQTFFLPDQGVIKMTGFYTLMQDRIAGVDTDGNALNGNETNDNISKAELMGAEFEFNFKTGAMTHQGNYTYQRGQGARNSTTSKFLLFSLLPQHLANYTNKIKLPSKLTLLNSIRFQGPQYSGVGRTGLKFDPFTVWNIRLTKSVSSFEVFVGIDNVYNKKYSDGIEFDDVSSFELTRTVPMGRVYLGGVNYRFSTQN